MTGGIFGIQDGRQYDNCQSKSQWARIAKNVPRQMSLTSRNATDT